MRWVPFFLALGIAWHLLNSTWAEPVQMPGNQPLPKKPRWDPNYDTPVWVWGAYEGYLPKSLPKESAAPASTEPLGFLKSYAVLDVFCPEQEEKPGNWEGSSRPLDLQNLDGRYQSTWLLLGFTTEDGKGVRQYVGWVPRKYVFGPEALRDPATTVHIKGFLVRSMPFLREHPDTQDTVFGLKAPLKNAPTYREVRLLQMFFIYAETGDNPETDWVLLGGEYELNPWDPQDSIVGWFPLYAVAKWFTREAVQWSTSPDRAQVPGCIWKDPETAIKVGPLPYRKKSGLLEEPIFEERFLDGRPVPQKPEMFRFPILPWPDEESFRHKFPPGWRLLKVGCAGGFVNEAGIEIASVEEIESLQAKLQKLQAQLDKLEILFVIDDTESMRPWFAAAADAVEDIVQRCESFNIPLSIGVAYYNDIDPRDPRHRPVKTAPLTPAGDRLRIRQVLNELRQHSVHAGGDPREMVFEGICRAIQDANFSPLATKLVVVLGDDADKSDENDPDHPGEKRVVGALFNNYPVPIRFFAIQVYPPDQLGRRPVARAFRQQMETIVQLYEEQQRESEVLGARAAVLTTYDRQRILEALSHEFATIKNEMDQIQQAITDLRLGNFSARISPGLKALLEEYGVAKDIEKLSKSRGFQIFNVGFVWAPDLRATSGGQSTKTGSGNFGPSEVEYVLLLAERELDEAVDVLAGLFHGLGDPRSWRSHHAVKHMLENAIGEQAESIKDLILKRTSLKAPNPLLDPEKKHFSLDELLALRLNWLRLQDVLKDREYDYSEESVEIAGSLVKYWARKGEPREKRRWFESFTGAVRFYWLKIGDEWP